MLNGYYISHNVQVSPANHIRYCVSFVNLLMFSGLSLVPRYSIPHKRRRGEERSCVQRILGNTAASLISHSTKEGTTSTGVLNVSNRCTRPQMWQTHGHWSLFLSAGAGEALNLKPLSWVSTRPPQLEPRSSDLMSEQCLHKKVSRADLRAGRQPQPRCWCAIGAAEPRPALGRGVSCPATEDGDREVLCLILEILECVTEWLWSEAEVFLLTMNSAVKPVNLSSIWSTRLDIMRVFCLNYRIVEWNDVLRILYDTMTHEFVLSINPRWGFAMDWMPW